MGLPDSYEKAIPPDHIRALEYAISWSIDHAFEDLSAIESADQADEEIDWYYLSFLSGLPSRRRHLYTPLFAKQFVICLIIATHKMAGEERIGEDMFSCVAEELAANLVIEEAEALLRADLQERQVAEATVDFGGLYDLMFEDTDFEWLFDPETDGIEHDAEAATELGIANLEFENWFRPFSRRFVHPYFG